MEHYSVTKSCPRGRNSQIEIKACGKIRIIGADVRRIERKSEDSGE